MELNYLAEKISSLSVDEIETFCAALDAGRHAQSVAELINLTENLGRFDVQPAFGERQYGEFLLEIEGDACGEAIARLAQSGDMQDRALAKYIASLEKHVDKAAYGHDAVKREGGAFTRHGYLTESGSDFKTVYRGLEDIPEKYRLFPEPEPTAAAAGPLLKVQNTDLAVLLMEMRAAGGDHMRDAKDSVRTLFTGAPEYFVLMNPMLISVVPAEALYRRNATANAVWLGLRPEQGVKTFFLAVSGRERPRVMGSLYELGIEAAQDSLRGGSFDFTHIDAEMDDGAARAITPKEWETMDRLERSWIRSYAYRYDPADIERLNAAIHILRRACEKNREAVPAAEFLAQLNAAYMKQADNPQPDMIRIAGGTANDMLARGDADVYRLLPEGPEKLRPIDAVKNGRLWFSNYREFAIPREGIPALRIWAERAAGEALRSMGRGAPDKNKHQDGNAL
jgi:hypothetical protein